MSAWPSVPLASLGEIVTGATPKTSEDGFFGGNIPFVTPSDLDTPKAILQTPRSLTDAGAKQVRVVPKDAVLVCCIASLGKVGIAGRSLATNQQINSVIFDPEKVLPRYGYHASCRLAPVLQKIAPATTVPIVSKSSFGKVEIPVPPLPEQRRIAAILDQADALRAKRREALAKLGQMAQAAFADLFGDLRSNAHHWPTVSIQDVCELIVDCVNRTAPLSEVETPYKMVRTSNVRHGRVDLTNVRYVDRATFDRWNRRAKPRVGDVLLTREAPVGEVGIVAELDEIFLGQRLMLYRTLPTAMLPEFLLYSFMDPFLEDQFEANGSGSTVKHLPLPACRSFELRLPPIALQTEFSRRLKAIRLLQNRSAHSLSELDTLFSSLQHRAFSGEL